MKNKCQICREFFDDSETYEYRRFKSCDEHFDELCERVDYKRKEVMEQTESAVKSQSSGEWHNGGYKNMKVDSGGRPIPSKIKSPKILEDYENGIL